MEHSPKTRGRPPKLPPERKIYIVDQFYIFKANSDPNVFLSHNIYAKLASFANDMGWFGDNGAVIRAKDFEDAKTRAYIEKLSNENSSDLSKADTFIPVYIPMNVSNIIARPCDEQIQYLSARDQYYQDVCVKAGKIAKKCKDLLKENNGLNSEIASIKKELNNSQNEIDELKRERNRLVKKNRELRRFIEQENKTITNDHFNSMPSRSLKSKEIFEIVNSEIAPAKLDLKVDELDKDDFLDELF